MNLSGSGLIRAPREKVWEVLLDPEALQACLPGCTRFEEVGPNQFEATVSLGVGAVKGSFEGKMRLADCEPPSRYTLHVEGTGRTGTVRGSGSIVLTDAPDSTSLEWTAEAQVGGLIASVGQRLLGGVAKQKADEFFSCMERRLAQSDTTADAMRAEGG